VRIEHDHGALDAGDVEDQPPARPGAAGRDRDGRRARVGPAPNQDGSGPEVDWTLPSLASCRIAAARARTASIGETIHGTRPIAD
jgi:hypothetical protein